MLEKQVIEALTEDQKVKIAEVMNVFLDNTLEEGVIAYAHALTNSAEKTDNIPPYLYLRACVAVEWARVFSWRFKEEGIPNSALKMRLAYDLLNPAPLSPNLFVSILEQIISNIFLEPSIHNVSFTTILIFRGLLELARYGSAALFVVTGLCIAAGIAISSASTIFAITAAVAFISTAILEGAEALVDSRFNFRRMNYDGCSFKYDTLDRNVDREEYITQSLKDRHIRPFDNLGFFKHSEERISLESLEPAAMRPAV